MPALPPALKPLALIVPEKSPDVPLPTPKTPAEIREMFVSIVLRELATLLVENPYEPVTPGTNTAPFACGTQNTSATLRLVLLGAKKSVPLCVSPKSANCTPFAENSNVPAPVLKSPVWPAPTTTPGAAALPAENVALLLKIDVPVTASAFVPIVAPPRASDVPAATPKLGVINAAFVVPTSAPVPFKALPSPPMIFAPVVMVEGAAPAPPPITSELAARAAEDAQVVPEAKYGTPPLVPATVSTSVPEEVIGEPPTEMMPPVKVCATELTVPVPEVIVWQPTIPELLYKNCPFEQVPPVMIVVPGIMELLPGPGPGPGP